MLPTLPSFEVPLLLATATFDVLGLDTHLVHELFDHALEWSTMAATTTAKASSATTTSTTATTKGLHDLVNEIHRVFGLLLLSLS